MGKRVASAPISGLRVQRFKSQLRRNFFSDFVRLLSFIPLKIGTGKIRELKVLLGVIPTTSPNYVPMSTEKYGHERHILHRPFAWKGNFPFFNNFCFIWMQFIICDCYVVWTSSSMWLLLLLLHKYPIDWKINFFVFHNALFGSLICH